MKKWLIAAWLILVVCIQAYYLPKIGTERGALVGLGAAMFVVAFPSSFFVFLIGTFVVQSFGRHLPQSPIFDFLAWQIFVVVGYIQWFVLLPRAISRIRKKQSPVVWVVFLVAIAVAFYGLYNFLYPSVLSQ